MGVWSFLSCVPLVVLYLYYPVMSSRYMMDFAPAFAVALWVLLQISARFVRARAVCVPSESETAPSSLIGSHSLRRTDAHFAGKCADGGSAPYAISALCAVFVIWWVYQITTARIFPETGGGVAARPTGPAASRNADLSRLDTNAYFADTDFSGYGLPFNGYGWFADKKWISSLVVVFLRDADEVELELSPSEDVSLTQRDWSKVRIKVGLEWLTLKSSTPTAKGRRLLFSRPSNREHRIEVAFISLAPAERILGPSKLQIDAVRWRSKAHAPQ
jgi:hypothetical protein